MIRKGDLGYHCAGISRLKDRRAAGVAYIVSKTAT